MMPSKFDSNAYLATLANDLIADFERASLATQNAAIGSFRESSIRGKLESVLPSGIGVGSGFVFDSSGIVSKQCDVIIYEKQSAISYTINNDTANSYYNCECVIAVGEVKSTVTKDGLIDSFEKIQSVRRLTRYSVDNLVFRKYLSSQDLQGAPSEKYSQVENPMDQIFTFLFCRSFNCSDEIVLAALREGKYKQHECFNLLLSTDGKMFTFSSDFIFSKSAISANALLSVDFAHPFVFLLKLLHEHIAYGRTVSANIDKYFPTTFGGSKCTAYTIADVLDYSPSEDL